MYAIFDHDSEETFFHVTVPLNFLSCNSFLSQMADTSMTILSQDLYRMSFLVHQAELQLMGVLSSL